MLPVTHRVNTETGNHTLASTETPNLSTESQINILFTQPKINVFSKVFNGGFIKLMRKHQLKLNLSLTKNRH